MLKLHTLVPLVKKKKRIGRGGSRGGTSGKGHKGQKARSGGKVRPGFEGGQMPLYRRLPKSGFSNAPFKTVVIIVNIGNVEKAFDDGMVITKDLLIEKGLIKPKQSQKFLLKLLGNGELTKKLTIHVDTCSAAAQEKVERAGGQICLNKES